MGHPLYLRSDADRNSFYQEPEQRSSPPRKSWRPIAFALLTWFVVPAIAPTVSNAQAAESAPVAPQTTVWLKNGDRLTGTLKSMAGGIEEWSKKIDSSVPQY